MVTVRVLEKGNELKLAGGQLVVGILIVEDILAVLLLVVLSGIGLSGVLSWGGLFHAVFLVAVFVAVFYTVGRFLIPRLGIWVSKVGEAELLTLFAAALAMGLGLLASRFDLSLALGAFVAGATISQTQLVQDIEKRMTPVRQLSGAVFFMSVGMWVDPLALIAEWKPILGLSIGVVLIKITTVWLGLFLSGEKPKTSFRAASAKPQIGEFSFVIAGLGISLGVTEERLRILAVGIAFVTILATPLLYGMQIFSVIGLKIFSLRVFLLLSGFTMILSRLHAAVSVGHPCWQRQDPCFFVQYYTSSCLTVFMLLVMFS